MRLGINTETEFLITLNRKNEEIRNAFLEKVKKITEKYSVDVMLQDGTVKKQQTFDAQKIELFFQNIAAGLDDWALGRISITNNDDLRRNFIKLDKIVENYQILLHFSLQYHVLLFYQPNYEVMKKQKELSFDSSVRVLRRISDENLKKFSREFYAFITSMKLNIE